MNESFAEMQKRPRREVAFGFEDEIYSKTKVTPRFAGRIIIPIMLLLLLNILRFYQKVPLKSSLRFVLCKEKGFDTIF